MFGGLPPPYGGGIEALYSSTASYNWAETVAQLESTTLEETLLYSHDSTLCRCIRVNTDGAILDPFQNKLPSGVACLTAVLSWVADGHSGITDLNFPHISSVAHLVRPKGRLSCSWRNDTRRGERSQLVVERGSLVATKGQFLYDMVRLCPIYR